MTKIIMTAMIPMMISLVLMMLCKVISKKSINQREKMTPFECGFSPKSSARTPFSIQFFIIAMIFLIFDIEIVIIIPYIQIIQNQMMMKNIITMTLFIMIITLGLYYEWKNGMIEWTK